MIKILIFFKKKGTNDSLSFLAKKKENTNMLGIIINNSYKKIIFKKCIFIFLSSKHSHKIHKSAIQGFILFDELNLSNI
jgi:hypothetical protein